jgi:hypothetical protein
MTPDAKTRLLEAVAREPSPARAEVQRRDAVRLTVGVGAALLLLIAFGGIHVASRPQGLVVGSVLAWSGVAVVVSALVMHRGRSMLGVPRRWLACAAVGVIPLLAAAWFVLPWPTDQRHALADDAVCFAISLVLAAGPLFALLGLRPEGDPVKPAVTGAAMGAAAGAWGAVFIDLHCEVVSSGHVLLGHLLPCLAMVLVGAAWGGSVLRVGRDR